MKILYRVFSPKSFSIFYLLVFLKFHFSYIKVSSRTLHIAWDEAGCLCPVGDLFNYAAPDDASFEEEDIAEIERLTDGGYEDSNAYCLYARKNYKKGEQVCFYSLLMLLSFFFFSF